MPKRHNNREELSPKSLNKLHAIPKNPYPLGFADAAAGPAGVLGGFNEPLRVGHEAEDSAGGVADAGDVVDGAVGVVGVSGGIA